MAGRMRGILSAAGFVVLGATLGALVLESMRGGSDSPAGLVTTDGGDDYTGPHDVANRYRQPVLGGQDWCVFKNLIGASQRIDEVLEQVYTHPLLLRVFTEVLGTGYKLWTSHLRCSRPGDRGIGIHQDQPAELGVCVLLSQVSADSGTTVVWPGSHRFPLPLKRTGLDFLPTHLFERSMEVVTGETGDVFLFFHDLWHGRRANATNARRIVFLSSLVASGSRFDRLAYHVPAEVLGSVGPELARLIDHDRGVVRVDERSMQVLAPDDRHPLLR